MHIVQCTYMYIVYPLITYFETFMIIFELSRRCFYVLFRTFIIYQLQQLDALVSEAANYGVYDVYGGF